MDDPIRDIHDLLGRLFQGQADLEARIERMFRKGKVTDVDTTNCLYRQEIGLDDAGASVKSPWLPYSQIAGARKTHSPPSVGEQYLMINPDGSPDFTQAVGFPHGWYDQNPSPSSDPNADVTTRGTTTDTTTQTTRTLKVGASTVSVVDGTITLAVGGVSVAVTAAGVAIVGGLVTHDQLDIGATHIHGGVTPGGGNTGVPNP